MLGIQTESNGYQVFRLGANLLNDYPLISVCRYLLLISGFLYLSGIFGEVFRLDYYSNLDTILPASLGWHKLRMNPYFTQLGSVIVDKSLRISRLRAKNDPLGQHFERNIVINAT